MSEVPGPPQEEQFKAPTEGSESDSLAQMQDDINEFADSVPEAPPRREPVISNREEREVTPPRKMPEDVEVASPELVELDRRVNIKERLENLRDQGRYGVMTEGVQRQQGHKIDNLAETEEEQRLLRKVVHAKSKQENKERAESLRREREYRREGAPINEYIDRGNMEKFSRENDRGSGAREEWRKESLEYRQSQIEAERHRIHYMYKRSPERYKDMPVSEFLEKQSEYVKDLDTLGSWSTISEGLGRAERELAEFDIEDASDIFQIKHSIDAAIAGLFMYTSIPMVRENYPENNEKMNELATLLGDTLFGDTVMKNRKGEDISSAARQSVAEKNLFMNQNGYYQTKPEGNPADRLINSNLDKSPRQIFREFSERIKAAASSMPEASDKLFADMDEKWGADTPEKRAA